MLEKLLHRYMRGGDFLLQRFGKKLLPQNHPYPPSPHTPNCHVSHLGGGEEMDFSL